jgi:hypothetical protein
MDSSDNRLVLFPPHWWLTWGGALVANGSTNIDTAAGKCWE